MISWLKPTGHAMKTLSSPKYQRFTALLREAREKSGLSQVEVAEKLNRPQSFVSKYESGERRIDVCEYIDICKTIGINPAAIISRLD